MPLEAKPFADSALAPFWGSSSGDPLLGMLFWGSSSGGPPAPILTAVGVGQHPAHCVAVSRRPLGQAGSRRSVRRVSLPAG